MKKSVKKIAKPAKVKAKKKSVKRIAPAKSPRPSPEKLLEFLQKETTMFFNAPNVQEQREREAADEESTERIERGKQEKEAREAAEVLDQEEAARLKKLGLVEIPVKGTQLSLLGVPDPHKQPLTMEQRVEMAKRLNRVGPLLPKYIQKHYNPELPGKSTSDILGHASEYNEESDREKRKRESLVSPEMRATMEAVAVGAMKVIAKHDPDSASAAFLSGKKPKVVADPLDVHKHAGKKQAKVIAEKAAVKPKTKAKLQPAKAPPGGFNKSNRPETSGELIRSLIMEHKLDDDQIATLTRKLFEGRSTKVSDVRWNRGQMRNAGVDAPDPVGGEPQKGKGK